MPMPGDPGFGRGPDLRLMAAKGRSINTRRQILQPDEAPRFQGRRGLGSGPGIAPPTRGVAPYYSRAAQGQAQPGGLRIPELTDIPGVSRVATAPSIMEMLGGPGPSDEAKKMAFNVVGESVLPGGGVLRGAKGLNFAERLLSRAPRVGKATTDRGPVTVQSMISNLVDPDTYGGLRPPPWPSREEILKNYRVPGPPPLPGITRERAAWQGGDMEEVMDRFMLEEFARGKTAFGGGGDAPGIQMANELPENWYGINKPRQPSRFSPQDEEELRLAMAHDDPSALEEMMQGGLGTPQMGGRMPEQDRLARMMLEELGGRPPQQVFRDPVAANLYPQGFSMQGNIAGPLAAMGAAGGYGWQQRQQAPQRAIPQQLRRRMPYMLSDNWR